MAAIRSGRITPRRKRKKRSVEFEFELGHIQKFFSLYGKQDRS